MLYPRYIKGVLKEALKDTPVVLLHGPRQSGKTTLARDLAGSKYKYITFDDDTELAAAKNDPRGFIDDLPRYSVLDEIQRAPELFPSIKRVVDKERYPGRFLLTGSANILSIPRLSESLAGRIEVVKLLPLSQVEIEGSKHNFIRQAFNGKFRANFSDRLGNLLFERVVLGGFPEPLSRDNHKRRRAWYTNYINVMVQKDITEFANVHYGAEIPRLLQRLANNTSSLVNISDLNKGLSFDVKTTKKYVDLLDQLFLIDSLQPWYSNRNKRLVKSSKVHVADTGLLCAISKLSQSQLVNNKTEMGSVLESFVYSELVKQASWYPEELQFFHYRDKDQYEVDIIVQNDDGDLVGIEVKLAASVKETDFKSLRRFASQNSKSFVAGYVLYDGERSLSFGDGLQAVPIQALWKK